MSDASLATDAPSSAVGDNLREARIAAGWTVSEVASRLNLTENAVESIEGNQFDRLPGTTFARGYIRSYAKILGLDADRLAKHFDQQLGAGTPASTVQSIDHVGEARRISRGMLQFSLLVILLIILGAGYYAWQVFNATESATDNKAAAFDRVEVERADGTVHVQTLDEFEDQAVALALDDSTMSGSAELETGVPPQALSLPAENATTEQLAETEAEEEGIGQPIADEQAALSLAPGMGAIELTFANDCWIRIVDADGKEISSGLQRAGGKLALTGKAPLDVRLGYAEGVNILYNGRPVDFNSAIRGATARFKLGE